MASVQPNVGYQFAGIRSSGGDQGRLVRLRPSDQPCPDLDAVITALAAEYGAPIDRFWASVALQELVAYVAGSVGQAKGSSPLRVRFHVAAGAVFADVEDVESATRAVRLVWCDSLR